MRVDMKAGMKMDIKALDNHKQIRYTRHADPQRGKQRSRGPAVWVSAAGLSLASVKFSEVK